jgi:hypothetical protein
MTSRLPLRCSLCGDDFALGYALAQRESLWRYRLGASIPPERLKSSLPVMAALAVLRSYGAPALPNLLGLRVSEPGWTGCEIDIVAAITDGPTTVVVIGEVKGGRDPIDMNDLENLERVQYALRTEGIEALILAATTRDKLTDAELDALRALADRAPARLYTGGSLALALPIVLVSDNLSAPWLSEQHPWRWGEPGELPLDGLALESCRRNLGLADLKVEAADDTWKARPQWS